MASASHGKNASAKTGSAANNTAAANGNGNGYANVSHANGSHANGNGHANGSSSNGHTHVQPISEPTPAVKTHGKRTGDAREAGRPIALARHFTTAGVHPYDQIRWERRAATINDDHGKAIFEQKDVEIPSTWSATATNIVVSKYFRGAIDTPDRERSVRQMIDRVARTIVGWGRGQGYFARAEDAEIFEAELTHILVNQIACFNSPVWFNVGIVADKPQCSACFIQGIDDSMESIMEVARAEAMLFKWGSGTGTNRSPIRASKERINGGGYASGPVSFMKGYDAFAGVIKCVTADTRVWTDQQGCVPIVEARGRIATGKGFSPIAEFHENTPKPIHGVELAYTGLQLRGTGNHPVLTMTAEGLVWKNLEELQPGDPVAVSRNHWPEGLADAPIRYTSTLNESYRKRREVTIPERMSPDLGLILGLLTAEGSIDANRVRLTHGDRDTVETFADAWSRVFGYRPEPRHEPSKNTYEVASHALDIVRVLAQLGLASPAQAKVVPELIFQSSRATARAFLRGYFDGDGCNSRSVFVVSASKTLRDQVQQLLLALGYVSTAYTTTHGYFGVRMGGETARRFRQEIGFVAKRKTDWYDAGDRSENTNIDVVPGLVSAVRALSTGSGWYNTPTGKKALHFGFFNRSSDNVSVKWLLDHPEAVANLAEVSPTLHRAVTETLEHGYFWDRVGRSFQDAPEPTYDITVPGEHSFVGNGIICHNSGGKTRRAAKMEILDAEHPDIMEFVRAKPNEEKKAWALIDAGYDGSFTGEAYGSVFFQNSNFSVRVTDEIMRAVIEDRAYQTIARTTRQPMDTVKARDLLRAVAEGTWICGDPGLQFDTTINDWHTCPESGRINASNPCCVTGDTRIAVADGRNAVAIRDLVGQVVPVYSWNHDTGRTVIAPMHTIEVKRRDAKVYRVRLDDGSSFRATDDHLIMLRDGSYRQVKDLVAGDSLNPFHSHIRKPSVSRTKRRFVWTGHGWRSQYRWIWEHHNGGPAAEGFHIHHRDFNSLNDAVGNLELMAEAEHRALHRDAMLGDANPARRLMNDRWRANISKATAGEKNPRFGRPHQSRSKRLMSERSERRWSSPTECRLASFRAAAWMETARAEGRPIGRKPGPRQERCCPACRKNFSTARDGQVFCSAECRRSPLALEMIGARSGNSRRGMSPSPEHREKLRAASKAAAHPADKRRAAAESLRARCLKAARLLLDAGCEPTLGGWNALRDTARELGAAHVPSSESVERFFHSDAEFREAATLYNHKVVSVEFDGTEDVYDGTVEGHHNFAIVTSDRPGAGGPGSPDFSGCFIHNSEYLFLDDSACNLSSINLMKFRTDDGRFDTNGFRHACRIMILAQEILVDNAGYPTLKIDRNSHDYRPLGLGYANLGALLMSYGLPYDSDQGRAMAAAVTALMCGEAYRTSAEIAAWVGPFKGFAKNRESMLRVIGKHRDAAGRVDARFLERGLLEAARRAWDDALLLGREYGYANSQVTVLAPTGTIGFMMDCDTTGVEPDIALVKYKKMVGGGLIKIVNTTVPMALRTLGYDQAQIAAVVEHIDKEETIEGAPHLRDEHLSVFDCAFKPRNGQRSIHYMGHVRMMSACQPFLSGAISKTVNMPNSATVEEIMAAYVEAWKLGVKAIAIYRDGSKRTQPLNTNKKQATSKGQLEGGASASGSSEPDKPTEIAPAKTWKPVRRRLSDERASITHKFSVGGHEGYITVGLYEDGKPGEIFIKMAKEGTVVSGLMDTVATCTSISLQYGVPLEVLVKKFSHVRFEPSGLTNNPDIPMAKSIIDYLFRWLGNKFLPRDESHAAVSVAALATPTVSALREAPSAPLALPTAGASSDKSAPLPTEPTAQAAKEELPTAIANRLNGQGHGFQAPTDNGLGHELSPLSTLSVEPPTAVTPTTSPTGDGSRREAKLRAREKLVYQNQADAPPCPTCGAIMTRSGSCYRCSECGGTSGCS